MHFLPIRQQATIPFMLVMGLGYPSPVHAVIETFAGRYETTSSSCRFVPTTGRERDCRLVQIDGRAANIFSLRFMGAGDRPGSSQRLTFVVSTLSTDTPLLNCKLGKCQLKAVNWQGRINSVSEANYDSDGLAESVPKAWAVRKGSCGIQATKIVCEADIPATGGQIRAEAKL